jgi:O-antigen/teichoic acid export membrane protein
MSSHWLVAISGWVCRGVILVVRFVLMYLLLGYLGVEGYALFAVLTAFEGWFLLFDLGLGFSLQNFLSEARARKEDLSPFLRAGAQLGVLSFLLALVVIYSFGGWVGEALFSKDVAFATKALQLTGVLYALTAFGNIAYRVFYAMQQGYKTHILQTLGALLSLGALFVVCRSYQGEGKLLLCLCSVTGLPAIVAAVVFFKIFSLRDLFAHDSFRELQLLAKRGLRFLGLGVSSASILYIDYLVMIKTLSSSEIVVYNVLSKLFTGLFFMYTLFLQSIWPLCSELIAAHNYTRVLHLLRKYCGFGVLFALVLTLGIGFSSSLVFRIFLPEQQVVVSWITMSLFGIYYSVRVISDSYMMGLQSMSAFRAFLLVIPLQACAGYMGQFYLSEKYGINGILLGLVISFILFGGWAFPYAFYKNILRRTRLTPVTF